MNPVNDVKQYIQLDNGANRQVGASKIIKLEAPITVQSFIPGQKTLMDTELKILNIGYFYYHPAARNIASEHQLEKNGFTITDVKNGNASLERSLKMDNAVHSRSMMASGCVRL
jgi:hypothetical protein